MKIKGLLLALIAFMGMTASAQDWSSDVYKIGEEYPGYIIDTKGKKTEGFIKYRTRYSMQNEVHFFTEKGNKKTKVKFKAADLKEYMVADKLYHCINYSGGLMAKPIKANLVVKEGCIMEYVWYDRADNFMTMQRTSGESDEDFYARMYPRSTVYYKPGDDKPVTTDYFALKFAKKMAEYVASNKELSAKVAAKEKGYKMLSILSIIEEYNTACTPAE